MSIESRIQQLEHKQNSKNDHHIHWMVPNPLGGVIAPNPKDCETCIASNFKNRFIILFNLRNKKPLELGHVRR